MTRGELEARLLAGQTDEDIADTLGVSTAGVASYHGLFFTVRERLEAGGCLMNVVLQGKKHYGMRLDDHGKIDASVELGGGIGLQVTHEVLQRSG